MPKANLVSRVFAVIGFIALSATVAHAGGGQGGGGFGLQGFQCYFIDGAHQTRVVNLTDQFGAQQNVQVGDGQLLCTPVTVTVVQGPELNTFLPGDIPDHLKCYNMRPTNPLTPPAIVKAVDQLGVEILTVQIPRFVCTIAVKKHP